MDLFRESHSTDRVWAVSEDEYGLEMSCGELSRPGWFHRLNHRLMRGRLFQLFWGRGTDANGNKKYDAIGGGYFPLRVHSGKCEITVRFDSEPRIRLGRYGEESFALTPFLAKHYDHSAPAERTRCNKATVSIGPILLAVSAELGAKKEDMFGDFTVNGQDVQYEFLRRARGSSLSRYDLKLSFDGREKTLPMQDFASASNRFIPDDFSIFI